MKRSFLALFFLTSLALPAIPPVFGQPVPRVKGKIVDFDGLSFHLAPEGGGKPLLVRLLADTRIATMQKRPLSAFKPGAFAGATVVDNSGTLRAVEAHLYPDALRGSGEGRLAENDGRFIINGAVMAAGDGSLTLFYRGAGSVDGICMGRADPTAAHPACTASAVITVPQDAAVSALVAADRRLLVPGAIATVSVITGPNGARTTPGLIVERPSVPQ